MAATIAGISTLGITFGYGMETAKGVKPTTFTKLDRINSIGGISIENETIDGTEYFVWKITVAPEFEMAKAGLTLSFFPCQCQLYS